MTMKKDPDPNQLCFNQCRQLLLESNDDTESSSSSTSQFPDPCEEGFMVSCIHTHYIFFGSLPNFKLNKARNACLQLRKEEQCKKQRDTKNTRYLRQSKKKGNTTISEEKCINMCSIDTEGAM